MQEFNIEIKNEKIKAFRLITLLIVILNTLFFVSSLFYISQRRNALISLAFILLYTLYRLFKMKKDKHAFFFDEWIYFLLMLLWVNNFLMAIVNLVLFLSYTISIQKIIYSFDNSFIKQKKFPWKKHAWDELSNVVLKDNMLTLDFKNNKLMQAQIIDQGFSEAEFNDFARMQLGKSNS